MWLKWFPWRYMVRRLAHTHGFLDPFTLLGHLHRFGQPSEVAEPIELLRAGVVFHARGLINSRVIQHNLDWVWPYWVERQFDPRDVSFVPRAFSITHINLTHRNWTAIGLPDCAEMPIVDPRGLLTPFLDSWSVEGWIVTEDRRCLLPSRAAAATQRVDLGDGLAVVTEIAEGGLSLAARAEVAHAEDGPACRMKFDARADADGWMVVALRPCNPEGVSLIHEISLKERRSWTIDDREEAVVFDDAVERHYFSNYRHGDVFTLVRDLRGVEPVEVGECGVGMATAAALFKLESHASRTITVTVPLARTQQAGAARISWSDSLAGHCALSVPDERFRFLYDVALRTLLIHSPEDVYPGPYTYRRFWFRDAVFIIYALLCAGLRRPAERALNRFPLRQNVLGYFHSQDGEWDSNGEALWIMERYCELTGREPPAAWRNPIYRGARWIARKRVADDPDLPHGGLLPAGFSAEHLGPNDFYYWDDFWSVAGLEAAARLAGRYGDQAVRDEFRREAESLAASIDRSLKGAALRLGSVAMPASPYRRLDAGAIGSLAVGYPLQLCPPDDPRLLATVDFLLGSCFVGGGFFQDMVHSGINPYLTLHVAQCLMRAGDPRAGELVDTVAALATPTGQWPEAIHPHTHGGCMGDGQHVWAAAEWVLMVRNCFVREEEDRLILAAGVQQRWLEGRAPIAFGPTPTAFGAVSLTVRADADRITISWQGDWRGDAPRIEVRMPGFAPAEAKPGKDRVVVQRGSGS